MKPSITPKTTIRVWDPLIRLFHWSLVVFFVVTYLSEDWLDLHVNAGYGILLLIGFRLIWGLIGARHARFFSFVRSPEHIKTHLKSMLSGRVLHYQGHNPVAALMVIALLISLILVVFSGLVTLAAEGQGPLVGTLFSGWNAHWMEEVHEFFANLTLLLIASHLVGVVLSSLLEQENLVRAMITGRKSERAHWQDGSNSEVGHEPSS